MAEKITRKIKDVLELSQYKKGQIVYWVNFHSADTELSIPDNESWIYNYHPKAFYDRGHMKYDGELPALHAKDFAFFIELTSYSVAVEPFAIDVVARSLDTGEFLYKNGRNEWMVEQFLFPSIKKATAEKNRIMRLVKAWARNLK